MPSTRVEDPTPPPPEQPDRTRRSGVLLHITSLPSPHGIGDIGPAAHSFLDWLYSAGQTVWQFLPLNPHGYAGSPYGTPSALASSPDMISLEELVQVGLLEKSEVAELAALPQDKVHYEKVTPLKQKALRQARDRFAAYTPDTCPPHLKPWLAEIEQFKKDQEDWLADYALYTALHKRENTCWIDWAPELRDRSASALAQVREELTEDIDTHIFAQYIFDRQWKALRAKASGLGIKLVGDIPIFVAYDSADVWANRSQFKLNPQGKQTVLAGVPPDYFSATGQLWGNPLYDWDAMDKTGYTWWASRFKRTIELVDIVRIDHFRGFAAAWEVPAGQTTAMNGTWVPGPGAKVFAAVDKILGYTVPVIAEDLGLITPEVEALRDGLQYPGMKIIQFAWGGSSLYSPQSDHLPHNLKTPRCVYYTGTHDNNTVRGWAETATEAERQAVWEYLGRPDLDLRDSGNDTQPKGSKRIKLADTTKNGSTTTSTITPILLNTISKDLIRLCLASIADLAIIQLQDALDLGGDCRMNLPATADGNWGWRVQERMVTQDVAGWLRKCAATYGRI
ncbi:4-alpha-glucanotransferase [Phlyctochytrium arcticum]|nr:4-alpha-glucanotransferase [Phlyctochytrium arcticum]